MSLPTPNLDDRSFQQIVDQSKQRIGLRCPEWTEHNVSDPGVTLIELFAGMVEMTLFRLNQVPEKNYRKFLELLGISLQPPVAATCDLRFRLSQELTDEEPDFGIKLPAYEISAGTPRTESEASVDFVIVDTLELTNPGFAHLVALPSVVQGEEIKQENPSARWFNKDKLNLPLDEKGANDPKNYFGVYQEEPEAGDALYFGFENSIGGFVLKISCDGLSAAARNMVQDLPLQVWEYFDAVDQKWKAIEIVEDVLFGFNQVGGTIELAVPASLQESMVAGKIAHWIRCRYSTNPDELVGYQDRNVEPYSRTPAIRSVKVTTVGGTVEAENCEVIRNEEVGFSDGEPGQRFKLRYDPVLKLHELEEKLFSGEPGAEHSQMDEWTLVEDFSSSGPEDRHFTFDPLIGEVCFGPLILQPDGTTRQYGAVPQKGAQIIFPQYRVGGGTLGNVRPGIARVLKSSWAYVQSVSNVTPGQGGLDREELESAKMRAVEKLRIRSRAVTTEDFSYLTEKVSNYKVRAHCVQPTLMSMQDSVEEVPLGTVDVLVVAAASRDVNYPAPHDLAVAPALKDLISRHLEERKLITTTLRVREPNYVFISTEVELIPAPRANPDIVARDVEQRLARFIHPTVGWTDKKGWPFGRSLQINDIYACIADTPGVAVLTNVKVYTSFIDAAGQRTPPIPAELMEGVTLRRDEMFVSRQHVVKLLPMHQADKGGIRSERASGTH